ncbi:MAG: hypothetical protein EG824_09680 [Deltaproteobacteria bacterium]|nr:hypothetical protein [Deltaproteobacteria bacterium]
MNFRHGIIAVSILLLAGCTGIGPHTVNRDRFEYTNALTESWKSQMLKNLVGLRYGEPPVFLDVVSVINQYALESQLSGGFTWNSPTDIWQAQAGLSGKYTDRPTITYSPLSGDKFTRNLMTPIPPTAVLSLIQAGYPIDLVLRVLSHSVNGIRNSYHGGVRARNADPEFYPLLAAMRRVQDSGAVGFRVVKGKEKGDGTLLTFRGTVARETEEEILSVRKILGLDPLSREFRVSYGAIPSDNHELALLTRSVLEILVDFSAQMDVPPSHVEEKRVNPTMVEKDPSGTPVMPLIRIRSSSDKPAEAYAAIAYRGWWYWIDDRDLASKRMFAFIMMIFSLTETSGKEAAPIVTIPAG